MRFQDNVNPSESVEGVHGHLALVHCTNITNIGAKTNKQQNKFTKN